MTSVELTRVSKGFPSSSDGKPTAVLQDFDLVVREGEFVTIFGPNGCGKTTVLNLLAGIVSPDNGSVIRNSANSANSGGVGYVFQNYADTLLPWRTVRANIALPLEFRRIPVGEQAERVQNRLAQFQLIPHAERYVYELSGGLKQLVAIARATVYDPGLLLLDEPFSALDYSISRTLWLQFREFWSEQGITTIFVSHNVDEAAFLGDRVCVLSQRPARLVAEVSAALGRKRALTLLTSPDFLEVRGKILRAFEGGRES